MTAAQQGDAAAFATLYRRYLPRVYRYFLVRTRDVASAEDLTAQTFEAVLAGMPRYRERGRFAAWLFSIVRRRYADLCRAEVPVSLEATPASVAEPVDPQPGPPACAEQAERLARLAAALRTLAPDRAQAVALHFLGGLTTRETAQVMERSPVAVKLLIHRALRDLRERMGDV